MKNSNVQEKSRGVFLFAFNTPTIDYVKIANRAKQVISHTLKLPVTIITDDDVTNTLENYKSGVNDIWRNGERYRAYELTPYDETLLLDSDYLMLDQSLLKIFDVIGNYGIITNNHSPQKSLDEFMGTVSLPHIWATAIAFKKTPKAKLLFDLVGRVQRNYVYYRQLYNLRNDNFRNDYAFTIANHMLNGYATNKCIPWPMFTIENKIRKIEIKNQMFIVRDEEKATIIPRQNMHIMDKEYLLSDDFDRLVEAICRE